MTPKDEINQMEKVIERSQLKHGQELLGEYHAVYKIDWKIHFLWTLSVICFILARLWWFVPLPGTDYLPAYRTYPANFLNTLFQGLGCALATRSITVGLVKTFTKGVHPDSLVSFGSTGGWRAMWSCIRHRSGLRYFLIALLVTAATLLGNALEGELQSSVTIYYRVGGMTSTNLAECQHNTTQDYATASTAYTSGWVSHTLADATPLLNQLNASLYANPTSPYSLSLLSTQLTPIQNMTAAYSSNTNLRRRHYHHTSSCDPKATATLTSSTATSSLMTATAEYGSNNDSAIMALSVDGEQVPVTNATHVNGTLMIMIDNTTHTAIPYNASMASTYSAVELQVLRYTHAEGQEAVIVYSSNMSYYGGVYVTASASNYSCTLVDHSIACHLLDASNTLSANNKVVADALADAIRSGVGVYGTMLPNSLPLDMLNGVPTSGALVDALYANPNCPAPLVLPSEANGIYPYSAAHWTWLSMLWVLSYVIVWLIGVYVIGYSEDTWSRLTRTGYMLPQIISNSPILFTNGLDGETVNQPAYLNPADGKMILIREHDHGYTVTEEEIPIQ
ncbi:uncharacterized protein B0P05DRAFT_526614 [Gilbertella persicaria]|uniref:uncharacterized protein n=1 Tax=Gilbertella persicaria TaxID=101096 RepID=UPI00221EFFC8|nr:uncharacterized protein B0P05DRAFT_526614 [Gilbertella persicaria]KAI8091223.1 hypothetical protein B0P05DRAFT_526614 [Gilbertella persicaria]